MPKGVYKHKHCWNRGLKKGDHPSLERMGFKDGHEAFFHPKNKPWVLKNLVPGFANKGKKAWNRGTGKGPFNLEALVCSSFKMRQWRSDILSRDGFVCQHCGIKIPSLHTHHIKTLKQIIEENKLRTIDQALECDELWNINNGVTLCSKCHGKCHPKKRKNANQPCELLETLGNETTSNQASLESDEGSETREYGLEQAMNLHERTAVNRLKI